MAEGLGTLLRAAGDVRAAGRAVVEALGDDGELLPSVYLERGGRLRLVAVHGYWQVRDGVQPGAGILGRTFARGAEELVQDVARSAHYLEAGQDVVAELCVPLDVDGRAGGVLNVEARRPLTGAEVERVREAARLLGARIQELGGTPRESPGQRLARHAVHLGELHTVDEIEREALRAALELSPLRSALLL